MHAVDRKLITFYCKYVDDTLLLIKSSDTIDVILDHFHKFDKNIRFTYDLFENTNAHAYFLDINISPNGIGIYRKDTFTGQYTNFDSLTRICSPNMVKLELKDLKKGHLVEQLSITQVVFFTARVTMTENNSS